MNEQELREKVLKMLKDGFPAWQWQSETLYGLSTQFAEIAIKFASDIAAEKDKLIEQTQCVLNSYMKNADLKNKRIAELEAENKNLKDELQSYKDDFDFHF